MNNICAVILAAGKGTRLNEGRPSKIPKALLPLAGKPMVSFILRTLNQLGIRSILVVGYKAELVKKEFGSKYKYVFQKQRLGTGHAAKLGVEHIWQMVTKGYERLRKVNESYQKVTISNQLQPLVTNSNLVLILQADDSAFYKPETIKKMIKEHQSQKATLSFLTTVVDNYHDLGRIYRDKDGKVIEIIEKENVTFKQAKINEVNCAAYLVNLDWARENLPTIERHLKKGKEYPLPDIIKIALEQDKKAKSAEASQMEHGRIDRVKYRERRRVLGIKIDSSEWIGINTLEQYQRAEEEMRKRLHRNTQIGTQKVTFTN